MPGSITPVNKDQVLLTTWVGPIRLPQLRGGTDQRLGSGVVLAYTTSSRAERSVIEVTIVAPDLTSADLSERLLTDCQNRVCDVTDPHGQRFPQCWCHAVRIQSKRRGGSANGGQYLIQAQVELEVLAELQAQNTIPGE